MGGKKASKSDQIFELLGTVDELNASLGLIRAPKMKDINEMVLNIQNDLFELGTLFAATEISQDAFSKITKNTKWMEDTIDTIEAELPILKNFILPGGSGTSAKLHLSRVICRRLERVLVAYLNDLPDDSGENMEKVLIPYVNRLSDLLFTLARYANFRSGVRDIIWKQDQ